MLLYNADTWFQLHFLLFLYLQHTSLSPDGKLLVIVGDNSDGLLVDSDCGKVIYPGFFLSIDGFFFFKDENRKLYLGLNGV